MILFLKHIFSTLFILIFSQIAVFGDSIGDNKLIISAAVLERAPLTNFGSDMYFEIYQTGTNIFRSNSMGTDNISNRAAINDTKQIAQ